MRLAAHFLITMVCAVAWAAANWFFVAVACLAWLSRKVYPKSEYGNCWLHALPLWVKDGGYLLIRPADGQRFLGVFCVPHVMHVTKLPRRGVELTQYVPVTRKSGQCWPKHVLYYRGEIRTVENPHNAASTIEKETS